MHDEVRRLLLKRFWWLGLIVIVILVAFIILMSQINKHESELKNDKNKDKKTELANQAADNNCPEKVIYFTNNTIATVTKGVQKQVDQTELDKVFKECPGVNKESAVAETPMQPVVNKHTSSRSTQSPSQGQTSQNQQQAVASESKPTSTATTDTLSMITPYVNESDISSVNEAFSLRADNPYWGFWHPGVDFMTITDLVPVQAAVDGTIVNLEVAKSDGQMGWHVGFCIEHNRTYSVCYNLETFSKSDEVGISATNNVFIKNGDVVKQGQHIANLVHGGDGSHIDFGVGTAGTRVCPEPFFTSEARESVLRLIHKLQPSWPMCDLEQ